MKEAILPVLFPDFTHKWCIVLIDGREQKLLEDKKAYPILQKNISYKDLCMTSFVLSELLCDCIQVMFSMTNVSVVPSL